MLFKIDFGTDFDRFLNPTWSQVGIKIGSKIDVNFERRFFKNLALPPAGAQFFKIWGSKLGGNFDQKSMKNGSQNGMHLGIDFKSIFDPFWETSWDAKSTQEGQKSMSKWK